MTQDDELAELRKALAAYTAKNDADHILILQTMGALATREEAIEHHLETLNGSVAKAVTNIASVTEDVGKLQLWSARLEGMFAGSRWTLTMLGLLLGLLGGGGAVAVLR